MQSNLIEAMQKASRSTIAQGGLAMNQPETKPEDSKSDCHNRQNLPLVNEGADPDENRHQQKHCRFDSVECLCCFGGQGHIRSFGLFKTGKFNRFGLLIDFLVFVVLPHPAFAFLLGFLAAIYLVESAVNSINFSSFCG